MSLHPLFKKISLTVGLSIGLHSSLEAKAVDPFQYINKPKLTEFDQVVFFGDSLTDPGSSPDTRFIAGGPDYPGYFDVLSRYYADKPSLPLRLGGTNYAVSASGSGEVNAQVKRYLEQHNGKTDEKTLHVLWSGGTDANTAIIQNFYKLPFYPFQQANFDLYNHLYPNPISFISDSAARLLKAGAPYVVVPNVPNAGYAPITSLFHVDTILVLLDLAIPKAWQKTINLTFRNFYGGGLDAKLRALPHNGQGLAFLRERSIDGFQLQFPLIPRAWLAAVFDTALNIQTSIARQFNYSVMQALLPFDGRIVYIETAGMLEELIEHAIDWHAGSVNLTGCSIAYAASECTEERGNYFTDRHYIFGDWFHPSWESHVGIAQYILSVLNAPDQVSTIPSQLSHLHEANKNYLYNYLTQISSPEIAKQTDQWSLIAGYSAIYDLPNSYVGGARRTYSNLLNLGVNYKLSNEMSLGALLGLSIGRYKPYTNFFYQYISGDLSLYAQWTSSVQPYWIQGLINYSYLHARNIERKVKLGEIYQPELSDSTNTQMYGASLRAGWRFTIGSENQWSTGPLVGLSYEHYQLKGFEEKNNHATSMHFDNATIHRSDASVGWYAKAQKFEIKHIPTDFYTELTYHRLINPEPLTISARIKRSPISFRKKTEFSNERSWLQFNANLALRPSPALTFSTGLGFKVTDKKHKNIQLSAGINYQF
ncbi:MAG: autotransporter domain-containing protein [Neisseriaceae bacterium]